MSVVISKIFVGYVYSEIQDSLAEQLEITNHEKFRPEKTGNTSENYQWKISLNEFAFKGGNPETPPSQNPDSPINPPSSNPQIRQLQNQAEEIRQLLESCQPLLNSSEQVKKSKEEKITQLKAEETNLDPNIAKDKIKLLGIQNEINTIEHTITMVEFGKDDLEKIKREVNRFENILVG